jgi:hypothetical protein
MSSIRDRYWGAERRGEGEFISDFRFKKYELTGIMRIAF